MILSLCFKRTCERSEEPISTGKLKVPSAKVQSEFLKNKVIPVVFGTEYCKEEGGLLLCCLVLVGEVNYHYRGILQFHQNHQAYFQGHLMLYQDMFDDFPAKDPQKWENHKMNKNLDSSF